MNTRFVLVRHATCAETAEMLYGRAVDASLDERGEREARRLAQHLRELSGPLIYCSPRLRTRQTAEHIARACGSDVALSPELDEVDYGTWAGRTFASLESDRDWQRWNQQRSRSTTPAGATITALQDGLERYLSELHARAGDRTVVLVTHAELIRSILMRVLQIPIDLYSRLQIAPASVSRLSIGSSGACVHSVNELPAA